MMDATVEKINKSANQEPLELYRLIESKVDSEQARVLTHRIHEFVGIMPTLISRIHRYRELSSLQIEMEKPGLSILQFIREKNMSLPLSEQGWEQCIDDVYLAGLLYLEIMKEAKSFGCLLHSSDEDLAESVVNHSKIIAWVFPRQTQTINTIFKDWLLSDKSLQTKNYRSA